MGKSLSSREIMRLLVKAGWQEVRVTGSHHHFRHPARAGTVTVLHPVKDMPPGTLGAQSEKCEAVFGQIARPKNSASSGKAA